MHHPYVSGEPLSWKPELRLFSRVSRPERGMRFGFRLGWRPDQSGGHRWWASAATHVASGGPVAPNDENERVPDEDDTPDTPYDEPSPEPIQDPPAEPGPQGPYIVTASGASRQAASTPTRSNALDRQTHEIREARR